MADTEDFRVGIAGTVATDLLTDERVFTVQSDLGSGGVLFFFVPLDFMIDDKIATTDTVVIILFPQVHIGQQSVDTVAGHSGCIAGYVGILPDGIVLDQFQFIDHDGEHRIKGGWLNPIFLVVVDRR